MAQNIMDENLTQNHAESDSQIQDEDLKQKRKYKNVNN